jgi:hypothetical protein
MLKAQQQPAVQQQHGKSKQPSKLPLAGKQSQGLQVGHGVSGVGVLRQMLSEQLRSMLQLDRTRAIWEASCSMQGCTSRGLSARLHVAAPAHPAVRHQLLPCSATVSRQSQVLWWHRDGGCLPGCMLQPQAPSTFTSPATSATAHSLLKCLTFCR